jgi:hypothetical protein
MLLTIAQQGRPKCSHAKSRKYAVNNVQKWKQNAKVTAIIDEFREDEDVKLSTHSLEHHPNTVLLSGHHLNFL